MRALTKSAVVAVAATVACTLPLGVAAAQTSPFGSLGSLGSSDPGPETPAPQVTASKTTDIAAAGEDITISGTGFDGAAARNGLYVGVIQDNEWSFTDADAWGAQTFVVPTSIVGGAWSTTLNIKAIQGGADCAANACSIYTVMAHGSTDRSQDTKTPITFAAPIVEPEPANPQVTASKTSSIVFEGDEITVTGTGFDGATDGVYVGIMQDAIYTHTSAKGWNATAWVRGNEITNGAFTKTIEVKGETDLSNCAANPCSLRTLAPKGSADRTFDTVTPVSFTAPRPAVTISKTQNIAAAGEDITVTGRYFSGKAPGLYVGVVQDNKFSTTDASAWGKANFVQTSAISDGTWSLTFTAKAVEGGADCTTNTCSIRTIMAHGSPDRTQDTTTPITFAPVAPANLVVDAPEIENAASVQSSSDNGLPVAPLAIGGAIAAGLAVTALRRRA
ncbi:hypothetical protein [Rhodococcus sp. (in: high G+C Gram-positive bacteria)]|uniref:hypothetical protein n=1 Tax=Rhodococcus sp. TaxID=1831 RepID=UPI003B8A8961